MEQVFYTIHNAAGDRIDDDADYPLTMAEAQKEMTDRMAETVTLGDGDTAWKLTDMGADPVFLRVAGYAA